MRVALLVLLAAVPLGAALPVSPDDHQACVASPAVGSIGCALGGRAEFRSFSEEGANPACYGDGEAYQCVTFLQTSYDLAGTLCARLDVSPRPPAIPGLPSVFPADACSDAQDGPTARAAGTTIRIAGIPPGGLAYAVRVTLTASEVGGGASPHLLAPEVRETSWDVSIFLPDPSG